MILDTVLQLSFRVLAIFLEPFKILKEFFAMLEISVTCTRERESCTTNLNTTAPYARMGLVTLMSHMTFWRENDKQALNLNIQGCSFLGVYSLYISYTQTTFHCVKVSFCQCCSMKRYTINIFRNVRGVLTFVIHCIFFWTHHY